MTASLVAAGTALWLGLLTAVSPCPLATNIAAVSYVGQMVGRPRRVVAAGGLYTLGRVVTYVVLGAAAVWGLMSLVEVSTFLQGTLHKLFGPLLVVVGMVLLGLIPAPAFGTSGRSADAMRRRVDGGRVWTAAPLGAVFALSFCPVSAALFFGSLVPLAVDQRSPWLLPTLYGIGTGLPVAVFALLLAVGVGWLGAALDRVQSLEKVVRPATGVVFIAVGIWETLRGVFHLVG